MSKKKISYKDAGVDVDKGNEAVKRIKKLIKEIGLDSEKEIGHFGGFFPFPIKKYTQPILVSSVDGVGTKLKVAFMTDQHHTIGQDLVNHCVNDILVQGARPLFFMDYLAMGKLEPEVVAQIVKGIIIACKENNCLLIGGETAEMPDFYRAGEYDLAGFIVGVVEKNKIIDGSQISAGDIIIGLASSGLHTNGYSLARKIIFEKLKLKPDSYLREIGKTVAEELLAIHRCYLSSIIDLIEGELLTGLAHITGGGITDNLARILPENLQAEIRLNSWKILPIFNFLIKEANLDQEESFRTFNMGIGMILICHPDNKEKVIAHLEDKKEKYWIIGQIKSGKEKIIYI
ncbi:MAG: phosphoribosylformylglycinamidine cyclo-ligase [Candidatus Aminicenantia bacterium]